MGRLFCYLGFMETKATLRKQFLDLRSELSEESHRSKSEKIMANVKTILSEKKFAKVFLFVPFKGEPDILPVLQAGPYVFGLPVVDLNGSDMSFHHFEDGDQFVAGAFGIPRPASDQIIEPDEHTLVLTPAVAATKEGYRIGFGRGYYDRFLARHPDVTAAVVIFEEFVTSAFQPEAHDFAASLVLTDSGIFRI